MYALAAHPVQSQRVMHQSSFKISLRFALAAALVVLGTHAASADETIGNDEVTLKNGGILRGTLVSSEPGSQVKIQEAGEREPRVIPWNEVAAVSPGKFAAPQTPPAPPPGVPGPVMGAPGVVRLHVESPLPVTVYGHMYSYGSVGRHDVTLDTPIRVCDAPCDMPVDGSHGALFSVAGDEVFESRAFSFGNATGDVGLDVSPGSPGLRTAGGLTTTAGSLGIMAGIPMTIIGAVGRENLNPNGGGFVRSANTGLETAGIVTLSAGVVALVAGIVMLHNAMTTVDVHSDAKTAEVKPRLWAGEF